MGLDNLYTAAIGGDPGAKLELSEKLDSVTTYLSRTLLHIESTHGNTDRVRFIVTEYPEKKLSLKLDSNGQTALHLAAEGGKTEVVEVLIDAARRESVTILETFIRQVNNERNTALHLAVRNCDLVTAELIARADQSDRHTQDCNGCTPIYLAAKLGYNMIVEMICRTCFTPSLDGPDGTTALHAAIIKLPQKREKDIGVVKVLIEAAKRSSLQNASDYSLEVLFKKKDKDRTALELAVRRNHLDVVLLMCQELPPFRNGVGGSPERAARNVNLKKLIYLAAELGYKDLYRALYKNYETGNRYGDKYQIAIKAAVIARDKEFVIELLGTTKSLVAYTDFTKGWTPLHYAAYHAFDSVLDVIVQTQREVNYQFVSREKGSPLHIAAKEGHTSTVIRLMQLLPDSCDHIDHKGHNMLHSAAVRGNKEMIRCILKNCPQSYIDKILNEKDVNGDTPLHILVHQGCFVSELIKHEKIDISARNNQDWTPFDMLYYQDDIIGDQIKIKMAFDDRQANQTGKFRRRSIEENSFRSLVPLQKQLAKDAKFKIAMKALRYEKVKESKDDLYKFRKRTNTQIIVAALITTVTFTVGFTMPGGYYQSEDHAGMAILSKKKAFDAFMVADALALALSTTSLFMYFVSSMSEDPQRVSKLDAASAALNIVSVMAMMFTFIAGTFVVLSPSTRLAITICIICSIFFVSIIVTMIKMIYDRIKIRKD